MCSNVLVRINCVTVLGATFQSDYRFRQHIENVCCKSSKMLDFILRFSHQLNCSRAPCALFNHLVHCILEHASIIWSPKDASNILRIEKVQKLILRYLYMREYGYYPFLFPTKFLLGMLTYESLETRRRLYLGKHFFKLLVGNLHNPEILEELRLCVPPNYQRLRTQVLFRVPHAKTNVLDNSPICSAIRLFNQLSNSIDLFSSRYSQISEALRSIQMWKYVLISFILLMFVYVSEYIKFVKKSFCMLYARYALALSCKVPSIYL